MTSDRCLKERRLKAKDPLKWTRRKMLDRARKRARDLGIPFDITIDDIVIPKVCPVLGIEIMLGAGTGRTSGNSPSLDRVIPSRGYVRGNVIVVSHRANALKNNASVREMQKVVSYYEQFLAPHLHHSEP